MSLYSALSPKLLVCCVGVGLGLGSSCSFVTVQATVSDTVDLHVARSLSAMYMYVYRVTRKVRPFMFDC